MSVTPQSLLKKCKLRDTQPRRLVLKALMALKKPASHKDIHEWIQKHDAAINLVTVYRSLETFEDTGIIHRHPSTGKLVLCSLDEEGHHDTAAHGATCHGFLSCEECGHVEEYHDNTLCIQENRIAKQAGFTPTHHMNEIIGVCASCK